MLVRVGSRGSRLALAQAFNDAATAYNNQRQVFPAVAVAGMLGFAPAGLLETEAAQREAPKVSFK